MLFYTHTGSFETNDLEIHCEDLYPMDLGTGGWTEFKMTEDVTAYIVDNLDLFNCDQGLIHSHHTMGAFFSGQDNFTLRSEGNDTNCFVSLIVDTRGTYQAAITRKVETRKLVTTQNLGSRYNFFGEGAKTVEEAGVQSSKEIVDSAIEYFMLDVQREEVDNPYDFLDKRFEEIEAQKRKVPVSKSYNSMQEFYDEQKDKDIENEDFRSWMHRKEEALEAKQPTIFSEEEMAEMTDLTKWEPDPCIIHQLVCQMVTCSLIVNKDIDLKQWVTRHMNNKYTEIFGDDVENLSNWKDFIVEFQINRYMEPNMPDELYDDPDWLQSKVAGAMYRDLYPYSNEAYIQEYMEILSRYIYE